MNQTRVIYERSVDGRTGYTLPNTVGSKEKILSSIPSRFLRKDSAELPEVTEGEALRHFISLSTKNHHIDKGFYPLGSCTMKYNPKLNDVAAPAPGPPPP